MCRNKTDKLKPIRRGLNQQSQEAFGINSGNGLFPSFHPCIPSHIAQLNSTTVASHHLSHLHSLPLSLSRRAKPLSLSSAPLSAILHSIHRQRHCARCYSFHLRSLHKHNYRLFESSSCATSVTTSENSGFLGPEFSPILVPTVPHFP